MILDAQGKADKPKMAIGIKQAGKAVRRGDAVKVFLAEDADERVLAPLIQSCEGASVSVEKAGTMKELGKACGIAVGAAAAAQIRS